MLFFSLSTWLLAVFLGVVIFGAMTAGLLAGRRVRDRSETLREPFSIMQGALLGFMGLVLAFGLSLAVGRYESRRDAVVDESNAIGTAYLRAQTIAEPERGVSLGLLKQYTDASIQVSRSVPGSAKDDRAVATGEQLERQLWASAGQAVNQAPADTAPRLYLESLNTMFDSHSTRIYSLGNRIPTAVLVLEIVGSAIAIAALALHVSTIGERGTLTVAVAATLVIVILLVTFDLDRPARGLIRVPVGPLVAVRAGMVLPPAAPAPNHH